jgi:hypothetical protein
MTAPKKFVKIYGVMKLNPEYKQWKAGHHEDSPTEIREDQRRDETKPRV